MTGTLATPVQAEILVAGEAGEGDALILSAPISFWGGVNPRTGEIADVRHREHGLSIAGKVLFVPGTIGSSSASAVLLELVHKGRGPAALVLHEPDAILLLGLIVAREMAWTTPVAVRMFREQFERFRGRRVCVAADGVISDSCQAHPGSTLQPSP
jgi:predicted aconitase with swiveling domain